MIIRKLGMEIDTENMDNNHLYTYVLDSNTLYKVEVNFALKDINIFLDVLKTKGSEYSGIIDRIEYDRVKKWPIEKTPYDKILEWDSRKGFPRESNSLLEKPYYENTPIRWIEFPCVFHELKKLVEFKCQEDIGKEKSIDLEYYLGELDKYSMKEEFMNILTFKEVAKIDRKKLEILTEYINNDFINMNKQIENVSKYLEFGEKNKSLTKKIK